ncbi:heavy-metal-associated domain-containing protein [Sulfitobacter sp. M13]
MKLLISTTALILSAGGAMAAEATTRVDVEGLTCPSCSYIVATAMKRVKSVEILEFIEGDAENGLYVLRYDDVLTDPEAIVAAVTGVGYGASLAAESGS